MGRILAVCLSSKKGVPKRKRKRATLRENYGLVGDAHAGAGLRQVSLLAQETLVEMEERGRQIACGGFGENLTTEGIELASLIIGVRLQAGEAILEVTQIGKDCHRPCRIYQKWGECILPTQGIFARVVKGGVVASGDPVEIIVEEKIAAGILTISDRSARGQREDKSGRGIIAALSTVNAQAIRYKIIPDESQLISSTLSRWADEGSLDVIITTGGTGFSPRDVTPEATRAVLEKEAPGLAEMLRARAAGKTPFAYLSRGVAGIRAKTLIINFPGSPQATQEALAIISPLLAHAIAVIRDRLKEGVHKFS